MIMGNEKTPRQRSPRVTSSSIFLMMGIRYALGHRVVNEGSDIREKERERERERERET